MDKKVLRKKRLIFGLTLLLTAVLGGIAAAFLINIFERKQEGRNPFFRVVELSEDSTDPSTWGKNFPFQYDGYKKTSDMQRTRHGGSEALPRTPTSDDPRTQVAQSRLEEDPRLKTMWAGYAFSSDFREERGHAYMLDDQTFTQRQQVVQQPGTCLHCHASVVSPYRKLGDGEITKGFEIMNQMPFVEARKLVEHPIACLDCHNPDTMDLRITRPGFLEGIAALKAKEGIKNYNPNRMASRQEMRTFVCAQCHVEYYFKGKEKRLVYPWANGLKVENIADYYDEVEHKDWTHAISGAPALKAQHPEFELFSQGIHARSGVSCADCHMPYKREGATKISDHHVRSPMLNIDRACLTCHHTSSEEMLARVEVIQGRTMAVRNLAMDALLDLIGDIEQARKKGVPEKNLVASQNYQRRAQFYLDFIEAENSSGFHAPQEAVRVLAESIDLSRKGQKALIE